MVAWCGQGPRGALVERVEVGEEEPEGLTEFRIRYAGRRGCEIGTISSPDR